MGLPDATWGEAVTAIVESDVDVDETAVIAFVKERLAGYKAPKRVLFVDSLPKNSVGKVQKVELVRQHGAPAARSPLRPGSEDCRA